MKTIFIPSNELIGSAAVLVYLVRAAQICPAS